MRMSEARAEHLQACKAEGLAPRYILEKERLLKLLVEHILKVVPDSEIDPFVHTISPHHVSSFLDAQSRKLATDGSETEETVSPATTLKQFANLRAFFD